MGLERENGDVVVVVSLLEEEKKYHVIRSSWDFQKDIVNSHSIGLQCYERIRQLENHYAQTRSIESQEPVHKLKASLLTPRQLTRLS